MGGPPLEFINMVNHQHQPKNGCPPIGTISMDLAVFLIDLTWLEINLDGIFFSEQFYWYKSRNLALFSQYKVLNKKENTLMIWFQNVWPFCLEMQTGSIFKSKHTYVPLT